MHKDGQPKLLLGHVGRDTWAGYRSHWRAESAAKEISCCCSTEPAGPEPIHLVGTSGVAKGLGLHAWTGEGEWWSTPGWKLTYHQCSLSPKGCPC